MTNPPNDNFSGGGSTMPSGITPEPQNAAPTPQQEMPTQAMPPAQAAAAQFTPGRGLPAEYVQEQESKKKKGKGVIASILGAIVAVVAAFLVRYGLNGGFTSEPSIEEVEDGIEKIYDREINTPDFITEIADELGGGDEKSVKEFFDKSGPDFAQCVANKVYSRVSKETKIDLSKAEDEYLEDDIDIIESAVTDCSEKLGEQYTASIPEPTKDEFKNGAAKIFDDTFNTSEMEKQLVDAGHDKAKVKEFLSKGGPDFGECVTKELYDNVSTLTKRQIAQGNDRQSSEDLSRVTEASEKCIAEAGKKHGLG